MYRPANDTVKTVGVIVLTIIILIQLEFLWHIGSRLIAWVHGTVPALYFVFCLLFIAGVFYAYRLNQSRKAAAQYRLHRYKRSEQYEREKKRLTDEQVRKLTDSRKFKEWQTSRRISRGSERLDPTDEEYFNQLEKDVFEWEEPQMMAR